MLECPVGADGGYVAVIRPVTTRTWGNTARAAALSLRSSIASCALTAHADRLFDERERKTAALLCDTDIHGHEGLEEGQDYPRWVPSEGGDPLYARVRVVDHRQLFCSALA